MNGRRDFPIESTDDLPVNARIAVISGLNKGVAIFPPPMTVEEKPELGASTKGAVLASQLYDIHCCMAFYSAFYWRDCTKHLTGPPSLREARVIEEEYARRVIQAKHEECAAIYALYEHHGYGHIYEGTALVPVARHPEA